MVAVRGDERQPLVGRIGRVTIRSGESRLRRTARIGRARPRCPRRGAVMAEHDREARELRRQPVVDRVKSLAQLGRADRRGSRSTPSVRPGRKHRGRLRHAGREARSSATPEPQISSSNRRPRSSQSSKLATSTSMPLVRATAAIRSSTSTPSHLAPARREQRARDPGAAADVEHRAGAIGEQVFEQGRRVGRPARSYASAMSRTTRRGSDLRTASTWRQVGDANASTGWPPRAPRGRTNRAKHVNSARSEEACRVMHRMRAPHGKPRPGRSDLPRYARPAEGSSTHRVRSSGGRFAQPPVVAVWSRQ